MSVEHCFIIAFNILIGFSELGVKGNVETSFQKATLARAKLSMITLWSHLKRALFRLKCGVFVIMARSMAIGRNHRQK